MSQDQAGPPKALDNVKHIILILSGKGGVGKSSVTTQFALSLALKGLKVGVLDIDLTGPSIPRMFGLEGKEVFQSPQGWLPIEKKFNADSNRAHTKGSIKVMSLGFLLTNRGNSVVWRGPKKTAIIKQFLSDVYWGDEGLDYLLIDTPPGTTDEHISIAEELRVIGMLEEAGLGQTQIDGGVLVTTPQSISVADVKKQINFCKTIELKILGIVENMSGFQCPYCPKCTDIFSSGGGEQLAKDLNLKFLGKVPIDPKFVEMIETQSTSTDLLEEYSSLKLYDTFKAITSAALENN
ncbi:cytosolic Fe-S cluster assembly factor cfd1 [Hanseniaspora osmophila]